MPDAAILYKLLWKYRFIPDYTGLYHIPPYYEVFPTVILPYSHIRGTDYGKMDRTHVILTKTNGNRGRRPVAARNFPLFLCFSVFKCFDQQPQILLNLPFSFTQSSLTFNSPSPVLQLSNPSTCPSQHSATWPRPPTMYLPHPPLLLQSQSSPCLPAPLQGLLPHLRLGL